MTGDRTSRNRKLTFEALENRRLLSTTYTWTGLGADGGNWSNKSNWNPNTGSRPRASRFLSPRAIPALTRRRRSRG